MDKINNLIAHDPENGKWGDCFRCCMAMILGLSADKVPHIYEDAHMGPLDLDEREARIKKFLEPLGLIEMNVPYDVGDYEDILKTIASFSPDAAYILSGKSRIGANHCVVCLNGEIYHDPSGNRIVGPMSTGYYLVTFFVPKPAIFKHRRLLPVENFKASGEFHKCEPEIISGGGSGSMTFCKHCGDLLTGGRG